MHLSQLTPDCYLFCSATLLTDPMCAADEIDTSKMTARMEFVPIDQLAAYADKKVSHRLAVVNQQVKACGAGRSWGWRDAACAVPAGVGVGCCIGAWVLEA